jgi:hypothetical protein
VLQRFAIEVVQDIEGAEAPAAGQCIAKPKP